MPGAAGLRASAAMPVAKNRRNKLRFKRDAPMNWASLNCRHINRVTKVRELRIDLDHPIF